MLKAVSSMTNAIGALNYKGVWNASTNTPTLASGIGTKGDYYQVSVAGTTALDGLSNWGVGDVAAFNGTAWQRLEGGADLNGVNLTVTGEATIADKIIHAGDTNTTIRFPSADTVTIETGGVERVRVTDSAIIFNEDSADTDFRVESDTNTHALFVDAGNSRVGINVSNPQDSIDIFKGFRQRGTGGGVSLYDSTVKNAASGAATLLATVTSDDAVFEFGRTIVDCQATVAGANHGYSVHRIVREILYSKYGGAMVIVKDTILSDNQGSINAGVILTTLSTTIAASGDTFTITATGTNTGAVGGADVDLALKLDIFGLGSLTTITMA